MTFNYRCKSVVFLCILKLYNTNIYSFSLQLQNSIEVYLSYGSTKYMIKKRIIVKRQVNINHLFDYSSIDNLYKFKSINNVNGNINVPVPSLSYLNPSFFYMNVLINILFIVYVSDLSYHQPTS
jgi:hypothetical protein